LSEIELWDQNQVEKPTECHVLEQSTFINTVKVEPRSQPIFNFNNSTCTVNVYYH